MVRLLDFWSQRVWFIFRIKNSVKPTTKGYDFYSFPTFQNGTVFPQINSLRTDRSSFVKEYTREQQNHSAREQRVLQQEYELFFCAGRPWKGYDLFFEAKTPKDPQQMVRFILRSQKSRTIIRHDCSASTCMQWQPQSWSRSWVMERSVIIFASRVAVSFRCTYL